MTLDRLRELAGDVRSQNPQYCRQRTWQKLFAPHTSPLSDDEAQELFNLLPPCKCCENIMTDLEHNFSPVVGTAKAALWLGLGERQVTNLCRQGQLEGAFHSGFAGKWLIPVSTLERIRTLPPAPPAATSDNAEITV